MDAKMDPTSSEYREMVADFLRRIDPTKPYGAPLYDAIARLSWNMAFEAVALRVNTKIDKTEVYLRKRAADDTAYPSQWHAPGSVRRPGESWRQVADRLANEFGVPIAKFTKVNIVDTAEARGSFESSIFLVKLDGNPREDDRHRWFDVDALPDVTVDIHRDHIIPIALFGWMETLA